jgi:[acyl-carrier-protein] S-malonyltransferase
LIRPAADKLAARLAELTLNAPRIPVINNVDVAIENDPGQIKDALVRQAYNPVRWVETIQVMGSHGCPNRGRMRPRQGAGRLD